MSLDQKIVQELAPWLKQGLTVQELIRARIVPDWLDGSAKAYNRGYALGYKRGKNLRSPRKVSGNGNLPKTAR